MMKKQLIIILLYVLQPILLQAEMFSLKRSPVFDFIYEYPGSISEIELYPFSKSTDFCFKAPNTNLLLPMQFLKNDLGLFILAHGSGYVYKSVRRTTDSIQFERQDSTFYYGYNLGSLKFCNNNQLYSLGGYGFWRYNGYLLKFNSGSDWQPVEQINYEVKGYNYPFYLSHKKSKLYVLSPSFTDDISKQHVMGNEIHELDLKTYIFKRHGKLNAFYQDNFSLRQGLSFPYQINFPFLNGCLLELANEIHLVSFEYNKVYRLKSKAILNFLQSNFLNSPSKGIVFTIGDRFYFTNKENGPLLSIRFSLKDFELLPEPLYVAIPFWEEWTFSDWAKIFISMLLVLCFLLFFRYRKALTQLREYSLNAENTPPETLPTPASAIPFSEFEELIIKKLMEREGSFTVDEINELLGVKKKSNEFQKKIRTEAISRINLKFRSQTNRSDNLIERNRSAEDKRFMQYSIPEQLKRVWKEMRRF